MGATVVLEDTSLEVLPGTPLRVPAVVTNTGVVVDAVTLDVVGAPEGWARVEPPEVRLLPGRRATVELVVDPPRASTTATGLGVLGLRARCREDTAGSCVEEAVLEVLPFADVTAELVPRSRAARGLRTARFVVAVDNRGNAPVVVELDAVDPDQDLALAVGQERLHCEPGSATFGTLLVRGQRRYWRGPVLEKGFTALVRVPEQGTTLELPGSLRRTALLPQGLPRLLTRTALLAGGLALGLALLQPQLGGTSERIDKAARETAQDAVGPVEDTAAQAAADAAAARQAAEDATRRLQALASPTPTPAPSPVPSAAPAAGAPGPPRPYAARLQVAGTETGPFQRVPDDLLVSLDGFVLQPNGDRGEMALRRNGVELVTARLADTQVFDLPAPVLFAPGDSVQLTVVCRNPEGVACDTAVLLTGTSRSLPQPTEPPPQGPVAPAPAYQPQPARTAQPLPSRSAETATA